MTLAILEARLSEFAALGRHDTGGDDFELAFTGDYARELLNTLDQAARDIRVLRRIIEIRGLP